jgi:hypothetical protein
MIKRYAPVSIVLMALPAMAWCQQTDCPEASNEDVEKAWEFYRSGQIQEAAELFRQARDRCQLHIGANTGLGYTAIRAGRLAEARDLFAGVLERDSLVIDALVGSGIVAWRTGDIEAATRTFGRVRKLEPDHPIASDYLSRLPPELGPPPPRPPLSLPDSTIYAVRANGDHFEVLSQFGWEPFYIKGINLGAALPGKHPSEFPDSAVYANWIAAMSEMGANAIRVYTIHPPGFYQALHDHNSRNPDRLLWLIHGVWTELPPDHEYDDPAWESEFFTEMHRVVDLLHGRADVEPRAGHAFGHYVADVSQWVLAYIIGREWEPFSVASYNGKRTGESEWLGKYIAVHGGSPMEVWLGRACEEIVSYEMATYKTQRPIAYTNWPTLDPLRHPTETTVRAEVALRQKIGETVKRIPREYDNDTLDLDATRMSSTSSFPAGVFAAFHAYPYYPDFMILDPGYSVAQSSLGPSNYFGYLRDLKAHHRNMPVVIAEYGVPTSIGIAHLQPQGWHHGGHDEQRMAEIDARLTREIAEAGMAGGAIFAWIDEWFKKNWIVIEYELPPDRNRLWLNRLDAEQHYGMIAMEPGQILAGATLSERMSDWQEVPALYSHADGSSLRAAVDEAYLWILLEPGERQFEEVLIGFDILEPASGDFRWPNKVATQLPLGIEFALRIVPDEVRLLADRQSNPVFIDTVRAGLPAYEVKVRTIDANIPPGMFSGRLEQWFQHEYVTRWNDDGLYDSLRVVTNRPRFTVAGREYAALGYDRGVLEEGPPPDGSWERLGNNGTVEIRIPWMLLNFTDPSSRRVLQDGPDTETFGGELGTITVESIGIIAAARDENGHWTTWPTSHESVARFTWPTWETPTYKVRRRPVFDTMRNTWQALSPLVFVNTER